VSHSQIISSVREKLGRHHPDGRALLETVSHAFNATIVRSLDPDYGAYEFFKHGVPICIYLESLRDVLVATNLDMRRGSLLGSLLRRCGFPWNPRDIQWLEVQRVCSEAEFVESAQRFQGALASGDDKEIEHSANSHVWLLTRFLVEKPSLSLQPWAWLFGGFVLLVGVSLEVMKQLPSGMQSIAALGERVVLGGRGYVVAETIRDAARKYVPRPQVLDEQAALSGSQPHRDTSR